MHIQSMPKAELHCHLEGCFRPATVRDVGRTLGIDVPADPEAFRREWLITEPMNNLAVALGKFARIQSIWGSEEIIERLTCEACEDGRAQGIRILELRYSPDFIAEGHPGLSFERIHRSILRGIAGAQHPDLAVGLIGIVRKVLPQEQASATTDFFIENRESVVGIDFADRDIGFELRRFAPIIDRARKAGLRFTTHCGEDNVPEAALHVEMAIAELGAISERRVALLLDPRLNDGLPAFLGASSGLDSGLMILQYTAAALASESKVLAHPASADSIPTSANQEDHVSMGAHGARRLTPMVANLERILGVEAVCAAQGIEFRAPLATSAPLAAKSRATSSASSFITLLMSSMPRLASSCSHSG